TFDSPDNEARAIANRILELRGTPFEDDPAAAPRGLSWSDCAILLRSVRQSGDAIVQALDAAGIPHMTTGLSNLFDSAEVQASVALFSYINGEVNETDVRKGWADANVGLTEADLTRGLAILDRAKSWDTGERWSSYNIQRTFLDFLEAVGL